jgi:hypothetical protein
MEISTSEEKSRTGISKAKSTNQISKPTLDI